MSSIGRRGALGVVIFALACGGEGNGRDGGAEDGAPDSGLDADVTEDGSGEDASPDADEGEPDAEQEAGLDGGNDADADVGDGGFVPDADSPYDAESPGIHMFLEMGVAFMMGAPVGFAAGGFQVTAREDFWSEEEREIPLDTCLPSSEVASSGPSCRTDRDCAPEQQCLPETNDSGQPVADTERCVTPRELMDVGPFTATGFMGGDQTFAYTPGQSGAYMTATPGDGSVPIELFAFDTTYTFAGEGDVDAGLGPFTAELYMPELIALTNPPMVDLPMGIPGLQIDPEEEILLQWVGATEGAVVTINITGNPMGTGTPMTCRVADDGEFLIPAATVTEIGFGGMAFFNMITLERSFSGSGEGEGLTYVKIGGLQTVLVNVGVIDNAE